MSYMRVRLIFVIRRGVPNIDADAGERLRRFMRIVCADFESDLIEFQDREDHVNLIVHHPPKYSVSSLVNSLKGVSSRRLQAERSDIADKCLSGRFWSKSYFAGSLSGESWEAAASFERNLIENGA